MVKVTVVIPTIPGRADTLKAAIQSISESGVEVTVHIQEDARGEGAAATRNRALEWVETPLVAFLDDDDEFYPDHLTKCLAHARRTGSDVVYPWYDLYRADVLRNDLDPLLMNGKPAYGQVFDPVALDTNNFIPITVLARTDLLRQVGGFPVPGSPEWPHESCEDWGMWLRLRDSGARFSHLPERTWLWRRHPKNTTGMPVLARRYYQEEAHDG